MRIIESDRLEELFSELAEVMRAPLSSPMVTEQLVVPPGGMARWLTQALARRFEVCANVSLRSPGRFARWALGDFAHEVEGSVFDSVDALSARLAVLLWELREAPELATVRAYLDDVGEVGRLELAARVARVLRAIVSRRPGWARAWDGQGAPVSTAAENSETAAEHVPWLRLLWRHVEHEPRHQAALVSSFRARCDSLAAGEGRPEGWPERVLIFGCELSPLDEEIFAALARVVPVHVFALSFSDTAARHPLVESMASSALARHERLARLASERRRRAAEAPASTLLERLQQEIRSGHSQACDGDAQAAELARDASLEVHVCHTPLREVEVLHDRLLDAFERDPSLMPEDVIVRAPRLDLYAPLVESVFGHRTPGAPRIPFSIGGHTPPAGDGLRDALLGLLALLGGRFEAPELMDLISRGPLRASLGLDDRGLDRVRRWLTDAGARWAVDAADRAREGAAEEGANTLRFAMDRLILGAAMDRSSGRLFQGVLPLDDVEGGETEALGRVLMWLESVVELREARETARTPDDWVDFFERALTLAGRGARGEELAVRRGLAAWQRRWQRAAQDSAEPPLSFDAAVHDLAQWLAPPPGLRGTFGGGVSFLSLGAAVGTPARVMAVLGMDDSFPRAGVAPTFDLVAQAPTDGDPTPRNQDREHFLWSVLSARERLLVTHVGRDARTNAERPPSVVLAELLDALDASSPSAVGESESPRISTRVTRVHPLEPYSKSYFRGDGDDGLHPPLFSYAARYLPAARALHGAALEITPFFTRRPYEPVEEPYVDLDDLIRTLQKPTATYLRRALELSEPGEVPRLEPREPLTLDALQAWKLRDHMLRERFAGRDERSLYTELAATGELIPAVPGQVWFAEQRHEVADIHHWAKKRGGERLPPRPVRVELDDAVIVGNVRTYWRGADGKVRHGDAVAATLSAKRTLASWVLHLVFCASSGPARSFSISAETSAAMVGFFHPVEDAREQLAYLVSVYRYARQACLPLFPHTSYKWAHTLLKRDDEEATDEQRLADAERIFRARRWPQIAEADEWENALVWQRDNPFRIDFEALPGRPETTFLKLAEGVYLPALRALEVEQDLPPE